MKIQMEKDKKLPQRYISIFATDEELRQNEEEIPKDIFDGFDPNQIRKICVFGLIYSFYLSAKAKEPKKIILPNAQKEVQ
jgi:hypothetical protein